jgi:D-alanine-D-alanine ligase
MDPTKLRIGFAYDPPVPQGEPNNVESVAAEYEDAETVAWLRAALQELGEVVDLPWGPETVARLCSDHLDVVFNITEAREGRNRESLIPALAEARGIPCTGTDALGLGLSLDKYITKVLARHRGVPTPDFVKVDSMAHWDAMVPALSALRFPVIVKPNLGGSSMGILRTSRVAALEGLRDVVAWVLDCFAGGALVEEFIAGREFTVGLLARPALEVLPLAEVHIGDGSPEAFFCYEEKNTPTKEELICPAQAPEGTEALMADYARRVFEALGCRDMARVDFRVSGDGVPYLLEINPLPGLSPYYSSFPAQAEAVGIAPKAIVAQLVQNALARRR